MSNQRCLRTPTCGSVFFVIAAVGLTFALVGCPAEFSMTDNSPVIASRFPTTGPIRGGTRVQIKGNGFTPAMRVMFGDAEGQDVLFVDSTELYATSPASYPGSVELKIVGEKLDSAAMPAGFLYSDLDSDSDGLTDAQELEGWFVWTDYFGFGFGTDGFGNLPGLSEFPIPSDPENADTDYDGLTDLGEFQNKSDPTKADTDGDELLDGEEVHRWLTSPVSVDTDNDARGPSGELPPQAYLFDGAELKIDRNDPTRSAGIGATSPTLSDTDGDGRTDYEEFDSSVFDPLLAELPQLNIEVVDQVDIRLNVEYAEEEGVTREYGTTVETGITSGQSSESSSSRSEEKHDITTNTNTVGGHVRVQASTSFGLVPPSPKIGTELEVEADYSHEWARETGTNTTTDFGTSDTTSTEQSSSQAYNESQSNSRTLTETVSTGSLSAGVQIRNIGDVSFALSNIAIAVRMWSPGFDSADPAFTGSFKTIGTLQPSYDAATALAPGDVTPIVQVSAQDVNADVIREFLADPGRLYFASPAFSLVDANGRNFAFLREVTRARSAQILIDFGDGTTETYLVATEVNRDPSGRTTGLKLVDALRQLRIPFATQGQTRNGVPTGVTVLTRLRGQPVSIPSPRAFWSTFITNRLPASDDGPNFEDIRIRAGDRVNLALTRDDDGDGLYAVEEEQFGTSDLSADTDGDGLTDAVESFPTIVTTDPLVTIPAGWDVLLSSGLTYHVVSDPASADFDRDGLNDSQERALGTDPRKADTDGDGIADNLDPFPLTPAKKLFVKPSGTGVAGTGQGTNWDTAFGQIYDALSEAYARNSTPQGDDDVSEIWVAAGIYFPSASIANGPLNLVSNVALYGGFTGTESKLGQRNSDAFTNGTFISGDRNGDGQFDALDDLRLVNALNTGPFTILDGFTLTHANFRNVYPNTAGYPREKGAVVHLQGGKLVLRNCLLTENRAYNGGAAIFTEAYGSTGFPTLSVESCIFTRNALLNDSGNGVAPNNAGGAVLLEAGSATFLDCLFQSNQALEGGAIYLGSIQNACTITNCRFLDNKCYFSFDFTSTSGRGGAIFQGGGTLRVTDTRFESNTAAPLPTTGTSQSGGAIYSGGGNLALIQCVVANNSAEDSGAAMYLANLAPGGSRTITNCTFSNNVSTPTGNAIVWFGSDALRTVFENCIFDEIANRTFNFQDSGYDYTELVLHSPVRSCLFTVTVEWPGLDGVKNSYGDPKFVNRNRGNYRIAGDSPCVDRGNNAVDTDQTVAGYQFPSSTDFAGNSRITDGDGDGTATIDIGAYEFQGSP
ncbi:MAG: right-handed parallel beta-helix repeat-containing protein [Phycisphaerae bacterium]